MQVSSEICSDVQALPASSTYGSEIFSEIAKLCGKSRLSVLDTKILSILAIASEPLTGFEVLQALQPGATSGGQAHMDMTVALTFFADRGVLAIGGMSCIQNGFVANVNPTDYVEMAFEWKKRLADSEVPYDIAALQAGARALVLARVHSTPSDGPNIWLYAPYYLVKAEMYFQLHQFLVNTQNFFRMREAAHDYATVPIWCDAVLELTAGRPHVTRHWKRMVEGVLPEVLRILEKQHASTGLLQETLMPLWKLLKPFSDNALLELFESALGDHILKERRQCASLALVQMFCEVGDYERAELLAREQFNTDQNVDNAHSLAIALFGKGQSGNADFREAAIRECIEIEERHKDLAIRTRFYNSFTARTLLSRAHRAMYTLCGHGKDRGLANHHRAQALECLEAVAGSIRTIRNCGYRAQVHFEFGDTRQAWEIAKRATEKFLGCMAGGTVLLESAGSSPLHKYFVPYCRLQAIAWILVRCPQDYGRPTHPREFALRWAIRENILPMAISTDPALAEKISPGISCRCAQARRGTQRISVGTGEGVLIADVLVWEIDIPDARPSIVLGLPEFNIFARGQSVAAAASNLQQIIQLILHSKEQSGKALREIARLRHWVTAHSVPRQEQNHIEVCQITQLYQAGRIRIGYEQLKDSRPECLLASPLHRNELERIWCWFRAEVGDQSVFEDAFALLDWPSDLPHHFTDVQKIGVTLGLTPHPIVKSIHEQFKSLGLATCNKGFAALEQLYWGLYLLGQEDNSAAEAALAEAVTIEINNFNDRHMLARMGDALAESLRRRGDVVRAVRILEDNIRYREFADISDAPSYVQMSKCCSSVEDAVANLMRARKLYEKHNRKQLIRVLLMEARITSDQKRQERNFGIALRMAEKHTGIKEDPKFQEIISRWDDWCRVPFSPELSYWGL